MRGRGAPNLRKSFNYIQRKVQLSVRVDFIRWKTPISPYRRRTYAQLAAFESSYRPLSLFPELYFQCRRGCVLGCSPPPPTSPPPHSLVYTHVLTPSSANAIRVHSARVFSTLNSTLTASIHSCPQLPLGRLRPFLHCQSRILHLRRR